MPQFVATTSRGLSEVLQKELSAMGMKNPRIMGGGVQFESNWEGCYKANLQLRTATRVVLPVLDFPAYNGEDLYHNILKHDWTKYIEPTQTLTVDASVRDSSMQDQRFVAMKVKDAVVDQFREKFGVRPDVDNYSPDLRIVVRIIRNDVHVSVDTSGDSLFKRGYRKETVIAPLKEHMAAGLLELTDWQRDVTIVDPMCGSGTFLIEAAMMALHMAPGSLRREFGFQRLKGFQEEAWDKVVDATMSEEQETTTLKFYGYDVDRDAVRAAKINAREAGVDEFVEFKRQEVSLLAPPEGVTKGIVVVNPPYGERLTGELEDVFRDMGFALKTRFAGWTLWVLSGNRDLVGKMGLKSSRRIPVFNGPIECRWLKYEIQD